MSQDSLQAGLGLLREIVEESPNAVTISTLGRVYPIAGKPDSARVMLSRLQQMDGQFYVHRAAIHAALGEEERAIDLLEQSPSPFMIKVHPFADPLRDNPRFQRLLEDMGLDEETVKQTLEELGETPIS